MSDGRSQNSSGARMHRVLRVCMVFLLAASSPAAVIAQDSSQTSMKNIHHPPGGYTIYVVPHSHMDLEWMWTDEQSGAFSIRILNQALRMLKDDPHFAFSQDQMQALRPFWDSLSGADKSFLRRMVSEGRFEVLTGMWDQPDINEPDYESLTRQFLAAKPWMEATFGSKVLTGWNIDTFGQTVQMPQLFRLAGLRYFFFSRDVPPAVKNSAVNLFHWSSPDGSTVLAHLGSYDLGIELSPKPFAGQDFHAQGLADFEALIQHNPEGNDKIMIPWGVDEYLPTESSAQIEGLVRQAASKLGIPVKAVVTSTPSRYFEDVEKSGISLPTYDYDFNPPLSWGDLRGIWGEHPDEKLAERSSEDMLEASEKISSIASFYGEPYPERDFAWAWKRILYNQNHDTVAGSHADATHYLAMSRYGGAMEAGRQAQSDALFQLSRKIDTSKSGDYPLLVFNALSFPRTELAGYTRTFFQETNIAAKEITNFRIVDPAGNTVPFRVLAASRTNALTGQSGSPDKGAVSMAEIEFLATKVPALGYRLYRIEPLEGELPKSQWRPVEGGVSNRFFELQIDPATGSISKLVNRQDGEELIDPSHYGGNELVLEEEKDPDMEGAIHFTGSEIRGSQFRPDSITELSDELGTTIRIEGPFMGGRRIQEMTLYNQLPRIDFRTELRGFPGHDGMLTVVFPFRVRGNAKTLYETHNAITQRPDGIYDAQTWVDVEGSDGGAAILNQGTGGHQIDQGTAKLILLRSVTHYRFYHAPEASEAGDHVFEYSLYPHSGDWNKSGVMEEAHSFNSPLRIISTDPHEGSLPAEFSFLSTQSGDFEVTALKKAEHGDEFILRGHETQGKAGRVQLHIELPVEQAWIADLLEQPGKEVPVHQGEIEFETRPFEFVTLRLRMKP